ncbi:MAG TPA: thioredoxin family protein [Abditibacteriaceae bacterium]|nr:thioredoxin family protein [Abditibacteriaceae bacterium]
MQRVVMMGAIVVISALAGGSTQTTVQSKPEVITSNGTQGVKQGAGSAAGSTPARLRGSTAAGREARPGTGIRWAKSMEVALQEAKRTKKPIMVDFYADWCGPCKMLDQYVYTDPSVIEQAKQWVTVKVDVEKNRELAYKYEVSALPTVAFLKPDGTVIAGFKGVPTSANLVEVMTSSLDKARAK